MISSVGHISIPVSDQDRALAFYTEKLGFRLVGDTPMGGDERWIEVAPPEGAVTLVLYGTPEQRERTMGLFSPILFTSKSLKETHRALVEKDVQIIQEPKQEFWGAFLIFADPDGNSFLVGGPLE